MLNLKPYGRYLFVAGLALLLGLVGAFSEGQSAWAEDNSIQAGTIPTKTPVRTATPKSATNTPEPKGGDDDDDDPTATPAPATATAVPPTATTVPPTATPLLPTATLTPALTSTPAPADGIIQGRVTDLQTGAPAAKVTVQLNNRQAQTNAQGEYVFTDLPAGDYVISVILPQGAQQANSSAEVRLDGRGKQLINLDYYSSAPGQQPASTPQTQNVSAEPPTVAPENATVVSTPSIQPTRPAVVAEAVNTPELQPSASANVSRPVLWIGWWYVLAGGVVLLGLGGILMLFKSRSSNRNR